MRHFSSIVVFLLAVVSLPSCDVNAVGPYHNLGKFTSRAVAEHKALEYLANRYNKLPTNNYEKVKYIFNPAKPNTRSSNAIWYNKTNQELKLEIDLGSGTCTSWTGVNQAVLNQIVAQSRGLPTADSLDKSIGSSYLSCIDN